LRIALRGYVALERERLRSEVTGQAVERLSLGWIALDARCSVIEASPQAEEMFRSGTLLRLGRYDRLVPASPAIDRRMTALVRSWAAGEDGRPQAFTLDDDPWCDMLVTPAAPRHAAGGIAPTAIVYVSGDRSSQADRCEQLVELFGMLPSEARLAWMLAQGTSIAASAEALGLTVETARNYSKKIYAKTGARGQAELVRIVLTSVLAIT
jgi:DNA-binding CsgD family transcriptional regulator